jgi:hypothetical protein
MVAMSIHIHMYSMNGPRFERAMPAPSPEPPGLRITEGVKPWARSRTEARSRSDRRGATGGSEAGSTEPDPAQGFPGLDRRRPGCGSGVGSSPPARPPTGLRRERIRAEDGSWSAARAQSSPEASDPPSDTTRSPSSPIRRCRALTEALRADPASPAAPGSSRITGVIRLLDGEEPANPRAPKGPYWPLSILMMPWNASIITYMRSCSNHARKGPTASDCMPDPILPPEGGCGLHLEGCGPTSGISESE